MRSSPHGISWRRALVRAGVAITTLGALLLPPAPARAADEALRPEDGYRISVLTMGPGDAFVTLFGHDALLVERAGLPALVYNFGMYTEAAIAPHHILGGTLRYFLMANYFSTTVAAYRVQNRSVVQQVLSLDHETAARLAAALSLNSRPANSGYAYDFARDNCTTRVRDALDRALLGALKNELRGTAALTYRDHALRFTSGDWPLYFLFDLGLGKSVDRPLSAWDDAYLPDRLAADLRHVRISDANGTHPLVLRESVLFEARRTPLRERPPLRAPFHALAGICGGALLFFAGRSRRKMARVAFGAASALLGAVVGALGLFVLLLFLTDVHPASHQNHNLLVAPPWAFGLAWTGLLAAFGEPSRLRGLARAAGQSAAISLAGVILATAFGQQSFRIALLITPLLLGAWLGARTGLRASPGRAAALGRASNW